MSGPAIRRVKEFALISAAGAAKTLAAVRAEAPASGLVCFPAGKRVSERLVRRRSLSRFEL